MIPSYQIYIICSLNGKIEVVENSNFLAKKFYVYKVGTEQYQKIQFTAVPHSNIFCFGDRNNSPFAITISFRGAISLTENSSAVVEESGIVTISLNPWSTCMIFSNHPITPLVVE